MPVCFQLLKDGEPQKFNVVDDAICAHFGVKPDEKRYYYEWYDIIGLRIALGRSFEEIRESFIGFQNEPTDDVELKLDRMTSWGRLIEILDFLKANYQSSAWYETKS